MCRPLYARYGDVLVVCKCFTQHTRDILEHVLEGIEHPHNKDIKNFSLSQGTAVMHTHLSFVLQEMHTDEALQKEFVSRPYMCAHVTIVY